MPTANRAPSGLSKAGRALWREVTCAYELDPHELLALAEACRLADLAADLEASARERGLTVQAVAEVRKLRQAVSTAVRDLAPAAGAGGMSASQSARALALRRTSTGRAG
jgi:hypothetical protein